MKIKHYLYNAFIIEWEDKKIAIDPGAQYAYFFRFTTLIPKSEWADITHIFVTHGDSDHYWHADRIEKASNASVICNETMMKEVNGKRFMLGPRDKGLAFTTQMQKVHTLAIDESIDVDGMLVTGIKTTQGPLTLKAGSLKKTKSPGPNERVGWGAIGFEITYKGQTIINLGETLLQSVDWRKIKNPDVLMIPIGGKTAYNTMDEKEALIAVKIIKPKVVIPMHYNCPVLFSKQYNPADDTLFKEEIEKLGIRCELLNGSNSLVY